MCHSLGTLDQQQELQASIDKHKDKPGALILILHEAQEIYGYLPMEVQKTISQNLRMPLANVYGVVTFYTQFSLVPKGEYKISICMGTACYVKGAGEILEKLKDRLGIDAGACTADGKFSLDAARCIGACGLAPVLTVNDDVHGRLKADDVDAILAQYE